MSTFDLPWLAAKLAGTWSGPGRGSYPTIESFEYLETITLEAVAGKPFLTYEQRTKHPGSGAPMHRETGFWRVPQPGHVELVLAHPTGIVEIEEGRLSDERIELRSTGVLGTTSAKHVSVLERTFFFEGDVLRYTLRMAAVGVPVTHHLEADLRRVS
jgi:hypothetical protein